MYERGGMCYTIHSHKDNQLFTIEIRYQNRYDQTCDASISIRPLKPEPRLDIETITARFKCMPAEYGVIFARLAIPTEYQGTTQRFELGMDTKYHRGKKQTIRYRKGIEIFKNAAFKPDWYYYPLYAISIIFYLRTQGLYQHFSGVKLLINKNIATRLDQDTRPQVETGWQPGDPDT